MGKFQYKGAFHGHESELPGHAPVEGAVWLKEGADLKKRSDLIQGLSGAVLLLFLFLLIWVSRSIRSIRLIGILLSFVTIIPHELLHGICFPGEAQIYTSWRDGVFFVTGPDEFTRRRFLFTALLPNLILGFLPFFLYLWQPSWTILGTMGVFNIAAGTGDYLSMYYVAAQVPRNALLYSIGSNTYWYLPENTKKDS